MNKKFGWLIGALVLTLVAVGVFGTTAAFADDGNPPPPLGGKRGPDGPRGERMLDGAALEAVAAVLNMEPDEVTAALKDGKTLPDLAEEAGVDKDDVKSALDTLRAETMREHIAQAVEDGTMSQDKADWLLEGIDKGFLDGPNFFGRHGGERPPRPDSTETDS